MRFPARALIVLICLPLFLGFFGLKPAFAQSASTGTNSVPSSVNPYNVPDTDPNVPANQHTRVQSLMIDLLSSTVCILVGVDPMHKNTPCLDVNPLTGKIGYNQTSLQKDPSGRPRVGGLLGASSQMISILYTPTIHTSQYTDYLAQNFGIVKRAYAAPAVTSPGYGFIGLNSLLNLWTAIRNIAYFLLMVAFIIIGLGIMLRVKVDPRTVMTLQNQIPRIIICIILVTFSYGIAGILIDTMWLTTYVGINVITSTATSNPVIPGDGDLGPKDPNRLDGPLSQRATINLLQSPITYVNQIFRALDDPTCKTTCNVDSGVGHITDEVSYSIGSFLEEIIKQGIHADSGSCSVSLDFSIGVCFAELLGFLASVLLWLVILFTVLKLLFSVWFTLIKAYTYVILYTIGAPIFIVMGLLPGKPLGFEKWLRSLFANLAVFPLTAFVFVIARVFVELFQQPGTDRFIPPLVGNPNIMGLLGWMIAFGILLMTPTLLTQLQEALKVPGNKYGGAAISGAIGAGAAVPKAVTGAMWKKSVQRGNEHQDAGWLRRVVAGNGEKKEYGTVRNWFQRTRGKLNKYDKGTRRDGH